MYIFCLFVRLFVCANEQQLAALEAKIRMTMAANATSSGSNDNNSGIFGSTAGANGSASVVPKKAQDHTLR